MQTVRIYSQDIGMECCIEICAMLIMKSGKHDEQKKTSQTQL